MGKGGERGAHDGGWAEVCGRWRPRFHLNFCGVAAVRNSQLVLGAARCAEHATAQWRHSLAIAAAVGALMSSSGFKRASLQALGSDRKRLVMSALGVARSWQSIDKSQCKCLDATIHLLFCAPKLALAKRGLPKLDMAGCLYYHAVNWGCARTRIV